MSRIEREAPPIAGIVAIIGGALLALGSFLPWAEVSAGDASFTLKALDGPDGYFTLAAGIVAIIAGMVTILRASRFPAIFAILAGAMGFGIAVYDAVTAKGNILDAYAEVLAPILGSSAHQVRAVLDQAVDAGQIGVSVGIGAYAVMAGGLVAIVGGVLGLRDSAPERAEVTSAATMPPPAAPSAPSALDTNESPAPPSPPGSGGP